MMFNIVCTIPHDVAKFGKLLDVGHALLRNVSPVLPKLPNTSCRVACCTPFYNAHEDDTNGWGCEPTHSVSVRERRGRAGELGSSPARLGMRVRTTRSG